MRLDKFFPEDYPTQFRAMDCETGSHNDVSNFITRKVRITERIKIGKTRKLFFPMIVPIIKYDISKIFQNNRMLTNLQKVQDSFYSNESVEQFLKVHSVQQAIKLLNKTTKSETKARIKRFFYKISESNSYKEFLLAGVDENQDNKAQFIKYISSDLCEEYFELLQKKALDVVALLDNNIGLAPLIFFLVYSPTFGIKMIKTFAQVYSQYANHNCLYSEEVKTQLSKGIQSQDSVVQMRFVQITANIAIHGGKSFAFVKQILQKSLSLYETDDILLKLNIVQIVSVLGQGSQTSQLLRGHKIWAKVEKDALDSLQELYVRKSLLVLLVDMATFEQYQMTPKFMKSVIEFLGGCFKGQGEQLEAGLELSCHLVRSNEGTKVLIQNTEVFGSYLKLSRSPQDRVKNLFVQNLTVLTDKTTGKKTKNLILSVLNCIGNPNLSGALSQSSNSNNLISGGMDGFCKWFAGLLQLPFEDLETKLLGLFINLLEYTEICEQLFENQATTKYILKPVGKGNTVKTLRSEKNRLVHSLISKGSKQWKNTKLEHYSAMIEKELQKQKMEMEIDMEAA